MQSSGIQYQISVVQTRSKLGNVPDIPMRERRECGHPAKREE